MEKSIEHIEHIVKKHIEQGYFPSAVCSIFNSEKTLYSKAFGYGNVNVDTVFDVASLSKIITSTEILMLINEGKVHLKGKVSSYLPFINQFDVLKERLSDVTIEQLLTHNSGIIDWYPFYAKEGNFIEILKWVISRYPKVDGTMYSDLNFMLLGEIIKSVSNLELDEVLEKYIKKHLSIANITYCPLNKKNIAPTSYGNIIEEEMCKERNIEFRGWRNREKVLLGEVNDGNSYYFFKGIAGHAGIFADVESYVKLCKFYMKTDNELLKSSMRDHGGGRGFGWQISETFPMGCGHSGFTGTSIWICNEKDIGAVIFTNRLHTKSETKNLNNFRKKMHKCILDIF
ncbi:CubicO group peptidase (beta-lactamase class C family) [Sedimentibacter acidaminivorans]|uniref:CubicO group peptidase (Beta-lactamase class C family) n=1 Tax=Sedimentibacter acidaminivorans TaxID=913099 RepID=A0ABS4GG15_9FIRM|nr:serine hydrolase [Sedimentibacter acidaminivorans]MBP1926628.1 CubicO group peptidase (beta-lactamase class C family) [Sedimentibacter acidaminivorans]